MSIIIQTNMQNICASKLFVNMPGMIQTLSRSLSCWLDVDYMFPSGWDGTIEDFGQHWLKFPQIMS